MRCWRFVAGLDEAGAGVRIVAPDLLGMAVGKRDIRVSTGESTPQHTPACMTQKLCANGTAGARMAACMDTSGQRPSAGFTCANCNGSIIAAGCCSRSDEGGWPDQREFSAYVRRLRPRQRT